MGWGYRAAVDRCPAQSAWRIAPLARLGLRSSSRQHRPRTPAYGVPAFAPALATAALGAVLTVLLADGADVALRARPGPPPGRVRARLGDHAGGCWRALSSPGAAPARSLRFSARALRAAGDDAPAVTRCSSMAACRAAAPVEPTCRHVAARAPARSPREPLRSSCCKSSLIERRCGRARPSGPLARFRSPSGVLSHDGANLWPALPTEQVDDVDSASPPTPAQPWRPRAVQRRPILNSAGRRPGSGAWPLSVPQARRCTGGVRRLAPRGRLVPRLNRPAARRLNKRRSHQVEARLSDG